MLRSNLFKTLSFAFVALAAMYMGSSLAPAQDQSTSGCRSQEPSMPER